MVELPKDATGCEIPLTTTLLYEKYGEKVTVYDYKYDSRINEWSVDTIQGTRIVSSLYLTPLDNWEKLEGDLKRIVDYRNSRMFGSPICAYTDMQDSGFCDGCKFIEDEYCAIAMRADILNRIRNLRGETHDC